MESQKEYRYLYIPLSFLQLRNKKNQLPIDKITGWAIINFARNINYDLKSVMNQTLYCYYRKSNNISNNIYLQIEDAIENGTLIIDEDYNGFSGSKFNPEYEMETFEPIFNDNKEFKNECIANYQFNIALKNSGLIADFENCYSDYIQLNKELIAYENKNGKDIYVSIKSSYLIDAMNGIIPLNMFSFIVAIKSLIQKRNYYKTTKNVIIRRMFGCKTNEIFIQYRNTNIFIEPVIENIIKRYQFDKLITQTQGRGFFTYIPAGRGYFISTRYEIDKLKSEVIRNIKKYSIGKNKSASKEIKDFKKNLNDTNLAKRQRQNNIITTSINDTTFNKTICNNSLKNYIKSNIIHQSKN